MLSLSLLYFLSDFLIRVFINTKFSPTLIIGRFIVRNQTPEYVGAEQKKFAWLIGIVLAVIMLILLVIMNSHSPISGLICMICLLFLFFESAFGICFGCKIYSFVYKEKAQYCPGEVCDVKSRHNIQKINYIHFLIILAFVLYIVLLVFLFNDNFIQKPYDLFGIFPEH